MPRTQALLALAAAAALAAVAAALVTQHVFDMQPCPWCVLQRVIFLAMSCERSSASALIGCGCQDST